MPKDHFGGMPSTALTQQEATGVGDSPSLAPEDTSASTWYTGPRPPVSTSCSLCKTQQQAPKTLPEASENQVHAAGALCPGSLLSFLPWPGIPQVDTQR